MVNYVTAPDMLIEFEMAAAGRGGYVVRSSQIGFAKSFIPLPENFFAEFLMSVTEHCHENDIPTHGDQMVVTEMRMSREEEGSGKIFATFVSYDRLLWH